MKRCSKRKQPSFSVMKSSKPTSRFASVLNFFALVAPIICLFDCIVLPIASAILPLAGAHHIIHGLNDQVISLIILAICLPVIVPGFYKHRSKRVLFLFGTGISLMFFVNFGGVHFDHAVHTAVALVVSFCLIKANLENKKLLSCKCSAHGHSHAEEPRVLSHSHH